MLRTIDITGVIPLPPQKATTGRSPSRGQNTPAGLVTSRTSPSATCVVEPVRHQAARHPLHGDGQVGVGLGRARHRVAAQHLVVAQVHAERAELAGPVGEGLPQLGGDVEHERPGVGRLLHDPP